LSISAAAIKFEFILNYRGKTVLAVLGQTGEPGLRILAAHIDSPRRTETEPVMKKLIWFISKPIITAALNIND
jgi:hypothetical protein